MLWGRFQVEARVIQTQETATVNVWLPEGIVTSVWCVFCLHYELIHISLCNNIINNFKNITFYFNYMHCKSILLIFLLNFINFYCIFTKFIKCAIIIKLLHEIIIIIYSYYSHILFIYLFFWHSDIPKCGHLLLRTAVHILHLVRSVINTMVFK